MLTKVSCCVLLFATQTPSESGKDKSGKVEEEDEEDEAVEPAPVMRLLKANSPEWPFMVVGAVFAAGYGMTMPIFSIIFSSMLKVSAARCPRLSCLVVLPIFLNSSSYHL